MNVADFDFELPENLIANYPEVQRTGSRLLTLEGHDGLIKDGSFKDILNLLKPNDLLVFNDTKVVPARLFGQKETGGKLEILFERRIDDATFLAHVRSSKSPKEGSKILLDKGFELVMKGRKGALFILEIFKTADATAPEVFALLEALGHIPLPPYIERPDEAADHSRYQTVYAQNPGAAAAPTAGLHFDNEIIDSLKQKGVNTTFVTLHVGAGTFQPVKVSKLEDHIMHSEWINVSEETVVAIQNTKKMGGRVVCVGTTSMRSIESASQTGQVQAFVGDTDIFIFPGYTFKTVDALITNFHLPKSTLLMLVSAFSGKHNVMNAYAHAIEHQYRFFSYGDAMFLDPQNC